MAQFEIPCPACCKHVDVSPEIFEKGGVVRCKNCGHNLKLRGRKNRTEIAPSKKGARHA